MIAFACWAGASASHLRALVLSSHLLPVLPLPGQHTLLKLLPMSYGEHLKEDCANVDIMLCPGVCGDAQAAESCSELWYWGKAFDFEPTLQVSASFLLQI